MHTDHTLPARVTLYQEIERDYLSHIEKQGIQLASKPTDEAAKKMFIDNLAQRGALVRNGGASIVINELSSACVACTGGRGSRTFILSLMCDRDCFFCFNPNQSNYQKKRKSLNDWKAELDDFGKRGIEMTHLALTGGEPLLHKEEMLDFFALARKRYPKAHTRLYTTGDRLDADTFKALAETKLTEIRFSIKMDDPPDIIAQTLRHIEQAIEWIPQVMVEMPVIPGTQKEMQELLEKLNELDVFGINLLEFCFPKHNWEEFEKRGFAIKNPPFPVLYDYRYAGGLPVAGSEELALELMAYALDNNMTLGIHYCSLENKHRDEIYQLNVPYKDAFEYYELDPEDFFLKSIISFDEDGAMLRPHLIKNGIAFFEDAEDNAIQFKPENLSQVKKLIEAEGKTPTLYCSYNIVMLRDNDVLLRELKLSELPFS